MVTSRSDCGKGSGRSSTESITAKIARLAPRQIAIVARAVTVKAVALRSCRTAKRRLFTSFRSQRLNWIDQCSSSRRQQTCNQCNGRKYYSRSTKESRIVRRDFVELRRNQPAERKCGNNPNRQ